MEDEILEELLQDSCRIVSKYVTKLLVTYYHVSTFHCNKTPLGYDKWVFIRDVMYSDRFSCNSNNVVYRIQGVTCGLHH